MDTYAVHGGNLISIELHSLTHRERHGGQRERENRTKHAVRKEERR